MQEDDIAIFCNISSFDAAYKACHSLAGIDRVEKNALMPRQHIGGGDGAIGWNAIAWADITVIDKHAGPRHWPVGQQRSRLDRQPVNIFKLHIIRKCKVRRRISVKEY